MQNIDQDNIANFIKTPNSIGKTSFRRVSTQSYYVDKTLLIKDVIDHERLVTLFTRPNLFGKTLNMDMLKVFFEIKNKDTSKYFYDKNIWKCGKLYQNYQGKYPVIYLTFKDAKLGSWNEVYNAILKVIQEEFLRHKELEGSSNLDDYDKAMYKTYSASYLSPSESCNALTALSELLFKHYKQKSVIIIDAYDTPIYQGFIKGFYQQIIEFTRVFYSATFKDSKYIYKGFIAGVLPFSKECDFNYFYLDSILDNQYSQYFGFTVDEVKEMAYCYNANDKYHEISDQYQGYNFGNTEIYNPVSIINYFSKTTLWSSWGNLVNHKMLERILFDLMNSAKKETIYNLLDGNSLETIFDFNNLSSTPQNKIFDIWFYLLSTGYLTARNGKLLSDGQWICNLVIPNKEVYRIYFSTIRDIMDNEVSFIEEFC